MPHPASDTLIVRALRETRTVALVGASANPSRDSYAVMAFLQGCGYRVIPVNPGLAGQAVSGETVYAGRRAIPERVDMADVFRRPEAALEVAEDAIAVGARVLWLQLGVLNFEAMKRAEAAGLTVIMDRCPKIEWPRLSHLLGKVEGT